MRGWVGRVLGNLFWGLVFFSLLILALVAADVVERRIALQYFRAFVTTIWDLFLIVVRTLFGA